MIDEYGELRTVGRERRSMTKSLLAYGLLGPTAADGKILSQLAEAGTFAFGGILLGQLALQAYVPQLGVLWDVGRPSSEEIPVVIPHNALIEALGQLRLLVPDVTLIDVENGALVAFPLIAAGGETYHRYVRFLYDKSSIDQGERHVSLLCEAKVQAVVLYGSGIPVCVPSPERYVVYHLIAQSRAGGEARQFLASDHEMPQLIALLRVLMDDWPYELAGAWRAALGSSGGNSILNQLPDDVACNVRAILK